MPYIRKEPTSRLSPASPDLKGDESDVGSENDSPKPNKKTKKILSPSELNLQLRAKYGIPLSVSRYQIDGYLNQIQDQNHKYFLKRYAINGKEFDVCWILCQGGSL